MSDVHAPGPISDVHVADWTVVQSAGRRARTQPFPRTAASQATASA